MSDRDSQPVIILPVEALHDGPLCGEHVFDALELLCHGVTGVLFASVVRISSRRRCW